MEPGSGALVGGGAYDEAGWRDEWCRRGWSRSRAWGWRLWTKQASVMSVSKRLQLGSGAYVGMALVDEAGWRDEGVREDGVAERSLGRRL